MGNFVLLTEQDQPRIERENHWGWGISEKTRWGISFGFWSRISLEQLGMGNFVLLPEQDQPRTESTNGMGKDQQTLIFLSSSVENERC